MFIFGTSALVKKMEVDAEGFNKNHCFYQYGASTQRGTQVALLIDGYWWYRTETPQVNGMDVSPF